MIYYDELSPAEQEIHKEIRYGKDFLMSVSRKVVTSRGQVVGPLTNGQKKKRLNQVKVIEKWIIEHENTCKLSI